MKNNLLKIIVFVVVILSAAIFMTVEVQAQFNACDFLPCGSGDVLPGPGDTSSAIERIVYWLASLTFTAFIGFGIFIIIKGALKIIRSQGDESKVEEGAKAIKGVMIGVGMLILGIVGFVVLFAIFDAGGLLGSPEAPEGVQDAPFLL
jgi:hypothetical protein